MSGLCTEPSWIKMPKNNNNEILTNGKQTGSELEKKRKETYNLIRDCANRRGNYLIPVLMMLGKTYSAGNLPADDEVDKPVTSLTKQVQTRKDIKKEAIDAGLSESRIKILPRFFETCPTAKGEHGKIDDESRDESWEEFIKMLHGNGVTPRYMHQRLGDIMPCQSGDNKCPYVAECDFDMEGIELLIGHPVHANIPSYVEDRIVLFDENAGGAFEYTVEQENYTRAVNVFLNNHAEIDGANSIDDLISASEPEKKTWSEEILNKHQLLDPEVGYSDNGGRADAALLAIALLDSEYVGDPSMNLRRLDMKNATLLYDQGTETTDPVIVVRNPPTPLASAWSVLAMDGTPTAEIWESRLGRQLEHKQYMSDAERARFIQEVLNYNIVQLTPDRTVSAAKANNINSDAFNGILHEIKNRYGRKVPLITSSEAKESIIRDKYISNKELHLGKVRSRDELESEELLAVLGSLHPGDRVIQRLAALDGYAVESNGESGIEKSYGENGNKYYQHLVHNEVAQAIFRVARTEEAQGADIYVYTANVPDWIPREAANQNPEYWTQSEEKVAEEINKKESATKEELMDATGYCERSIQSALQSLENNDLVESKIGQGRYAKKRWFDDGIADRNPHLKNVSIMDQSHESIGMQHSQLTI